MGDQVRNGEYITVQGETTVQVFLYDFNFSEWRETHIFRHHVTSCRGHVSRVKFDANLQQQNILPGDFLLRRPWRMHSSWHLQFLGPVKDSDGN